MTLKDDIEAYRVISNENPYSDQLERATINLGFSFLSEITASLGLASQSLGRIADLLEREENRQRIAPSKEKDSSK